MKTKNQELKKAIKELKTKAKKPHCPSCSKVLYWNYVDRNEYKEDGKLMCYHCYATVKTYKKKVTNK